MSSTAIPVVSCVFQRVVRERDRQRGAGHLIGLPLTEPGSLGYAVVLEPGRIRGSGPICRQVVRGFESPWHGSDTHVQSVGDGPIVETLAV